MHENVIILFELSFWGWPYSKIIIILLEIIIEIMKLILNSSFSQKLLISISQLLINFWSCEDYVAFESFLPRSSTCTVMILSFGPDMSNSVDHDQKTPFRSTAPSGAVWSGSLLFVILSASFGCFSSLGWLQQLFRISKFFRFLRYCNSHTLLLL